MFCFEIYAFCFGLSIRFACTLSTITISSTVWLCLGVVVFLFLNQYIRMAKRTRVVMSSGYGVLALVATNNCLYVMWLYSSSVASYDSYRWFMSTSVVNHLSVASTTSSLACSRSFTSFILYLTDLGRGIPVLIAF